MMKDNSSKYFCFPKTQRLMILYSNPAVFKDDLFQSLYIQMSPKNSKLFRLRRTKIGHFLSGVLKNSIVVKDIPTTEASIGYQSRDKLILFKRELNSYSVWSRNSNSTSWNKESFLGLPLIYKYELDHIRNRIPLIKSTLAAHWNNLKKEGSKHIHGDFTHFNILIDAKDHINYIDKKNCNQNILFDHFYFYSYLIQCLTLCESLPDKDFLIIKKEIESILVELKINQLNDFERQVEQIELAECWGLKPSFKDKSKQNFINLFL